MKLLLLLREAQFHGAKRIVDKRFRWLWIVAMSVLFGFSVTVLYLTVERFLSNPTFLVQMESYNRVTPFPSVLICPEINFREDKIDGFLTRMHLPRGRNTTYYKKVIRQLAAFYSPDVKYTLTDLENIEHLLSFNGLDVYNEGKKLTTSCEETLFRCRWNNLLVNCSSLFQMELTGVGYCCVFNGRSLKREHIVSENPATNLEGKSFGKFYGYTSGLMLVVNQSNKVDNIDLSYKWLALQSNQHFIETSINGTPLNPGAEQWAAYHFREFQIAEEAKNLGSHIRHCRMAEEPLIFFPFYHKDYCILECEIMRTVKRCHCARISHPRPYGVPNCRARNLKCAKHTMVSFDSSECNCPQGCDIPMDYVKFTSFNLWQTGSTYDPFYDDLDLSKVSIVRVFIQNGHMKINSRWSYFGQLDLFSQLGGIFSVFFGISILTVAELIQLCYHGLQSWKSKRNAYKPNT